MWVHPPGCPACEYVQGNQKIAKGVAHSEECRKRIRDAVAEDDDENERITRADERKALRQDNGGVRGIGQGLGTPGLGSMPRHVAKLQRELGVQMPIMAAEGIYVVETHSPPRIAMRAQEFGLRPGWSFDFTTKARPRTSLGQK